MKYCLIPCLKFCFLTLKERSVYGYKHDKFIHAKWTAKYTHWIRRYFNKSRRITRSRVPAAVPPERAASRCRSLRRRPMLREFPPQTRWVPWGSRTLLQPPSRRRWDSYRGYQSRKPGSGGAQCSNRVQYLGSLSNSRLRNKVKMIVRTPPELPKNIFN